MRKNSFPYLITRFTPSFLLHPPTQSASFIFLLLPLPVTPPLPLLLLTPSTLSPPSFPPSFILLLLTSSTLSHPSLPPSSSSSPHPHCLIHPSLPPFSLLPSSLLFLLLRVFSWSLACRLTICIMSKGKRTSGMTYGRGRNDLEGIHLSTRDVALMIIPRPPACLGVLWGMSREGEAEGMGLPRWE
ncbi:hypothetical protein Pmani_036088 [Petrolisthes manimaculis]|uniref:Uncharacterized protein n=1 Tax=Petrolisthes manimaculis TaxID=1843537 RepID=A0AAE1NKB8_9EUCA|nr:hypothetical protein Pmani_036088 [Petrolisthes manimaculis]